MPRLKKWTPCIVQWGDAVTHHDPANSDDEFPIAERSSTGFLLRQDKTGITIAMEDDRRCAELGAHDCQTVTTIPKGMIRKITALAPIDKPPATKSPLTPQDDATDANAEP